MEDGIGLVDNVWQEQPMAAVTGRPAVQHTIPGQRRVPVPMRLGPLSDPLLFNSPANVHRIE
jgi:hypothetical protein